MRLSTVTALGLAVVFLSSFFLSFFLFKKENLMNVVRELN